MRACEEDRGTRTGAVRGSASTTGGGNSGSGGNRSSLGRKGESGEESEEESLELHFECGCFVGVFDGGEKAKLWWLKVVKNGEESKVNEWTERVSMVVGTERENEREVRSTGLCSHLTCPLNATIFRSADMLGGE